MSDIFFLLQERLDFYRLMDNFITILSKLNDTESAAKSKISFDKIRGHFLHCLVLVGVMEMQLWVWICVINM